FSAGHAWRQFSTHNAHTSLVRISKEKLESLFPLGVTAGRSPLRIVDCRTSSEFLQDHIPGSINIPVLSDQQRCQIGKQFQVSKIQARINGAAQICLNVGNELLNEGSVTRSLIEEICHSKGGVGLIFYCSRGGKRSQSLGQLFAALGFASWVGVLEEGYKTWRSFILHRLDHWPTSREHLGALPFVTVSGLTGSGKSLILNLLAKKSLRNLSVLDLERIADHKGSMLGAPIDRQSVMNQKKFDSLLHEELIRFLASTDAQRTVWTECESRWVGPVCQMNAALWNRLRGLHGSPLPQRIFIHVPLEARVDYILKDYSYFVEQSSTPFFLDLLEKFKKFHPDSLVEQWKSMALRGDATLVIELLRKHYDVNYSHSRKQLLSQSEENNKLQHLNLSSVDELTIERELMPRLLEINEQVNHAWFQ
ncbi:NEDD8-activating protein uba3, partial [Cichlidogyrus casuarinus]